MPLCPVYSHSISTDGWCSICSKTHKIRSVKAKGEHDMLVFLVAMNIMFIILILLGYDSP